MQLEGKVALVTGGGTGIGAGVVERFVAEGAKVLITGRRKEMLDKVAASLPAGSVTTFVGDVVRRGQRGAHGRRGSRHQRPAWTSW